MSYYILGINVCTFFNLGCNNSTTNGVSAIGTTSAIPIQSTQYPYPNPVKYESDILVVNIIATPNNIDQNIDVAINLPLFFIKSSNFFPPLNIINAGKAALRPTVIPSVNGECKRIKLPLNNAHTNVCLLYTSRCV